MVAYDEFARFMWILVRALETSTLQFATPPQYHHFSIHNELVGDLYLDLYVEIIQYLVIGEVILLGDFNARTQAC
jgi:hypothetical protein